MQNYTLAPGAQVTAPFPSRCLERDLKIMINFYLVLFYATLILLSRQVCRLLVQLLLSGQSVQRAGSEIPTQQRPGLVLHRAEQGGQHCRSAGLVP